MLMDDADTLTKGSVIKNHARPACGPGNAVRSQERLHELNPAGSSSVRRGSKSGDLAICRSDMMIRGRSDQHRLGLIRSSGRLSARYDYFLCNPHTGWSEESREAVRDEHDRLGDNGRSVRDYPDK